MNARSLESYRKAAAAVVCVLAPLVFAPAFVLLLGPHTEKVGVFRMRNLLKGHKAEYSMALITFKKQDPRPVPLYADIITLDDRTGGFTLGRTSLNP